MAKLPQYNSDGQTCFVTAVTAQHRKILVRHAGLLIRAVLNAQRRSPFELVAGVIMPDHFHAVIETSDGDVSKIMQRVKWSFALQWRQQSNRTGPVWQPGYRDSVIRSGADLKRHLDNIHYDPVKHGLTELPKDWLLSSFFRYVRDGYYDSDWGSTRTISRVNVYGK